MRYLLILCFLSTSLLAQSPWSASLHVNLGYGEISSIQIFETNVSYFGTYTYGLNCGVHYSLNDRWEFSTGLAFQDRGEKAYFHIPDQWIGSGGNVIKDPAIPTDDFYFRDGYLFLELPLGINYYFQDKVAGWLLRAQILNSFYLSTARHTRSINPNVDDDFDTFRDQSIKVYQINLMMGGAYRWKLSNNWSTNLGLMLQQSITPLNAGSSIYLHHMIAVEMGLIKRF